MKKKIGMKEKLWLHKLHKLEIPIKSFHTEKHESHYLCFKI